MSVYELLCKARDVFAERGGAKCVLEDYTTGKVCARGALNVVETGQAFWVVGNYSDNYSAEYDQVLNILHDTTPAPFSNIIIFNNENATTKDDILAVFDKAIAGIEEAGNEYK